MPEAGYLLETEEDSLARRWWIWSWEHTQAVAESLKVLLPGEQRDHRGRPGFGDWAERTPPSGEVGGVCETQRRRTV